MTVLAYIAYCALYATAAYGLAAIVAAVVERLTRAKPARLVVVPDEPFDVTLRNLEQNAGIDVRALLRESKYADMRPTADSIATYEAFQRRERVLKARRLRREARARIVARIKAFFTRKVS